jgi:hypothetical protein
MKTEVSGPLYAFIGLAIGIFLIGFGISGMLFN